MNDEVAATTTTTRWATKARASGTLISERNMKGYIYIAGAFRTLDPTSRFVDNDPHFWREPPTWGICRWDLRACAAEGDVIFFVLPKRSGLPQTIFAYLTIESIMTHAEAYVDPRLIDKRMGPGKRPNGNIIVNEAGEYEEFDGWVHEENVDAIKRFYAVGSAEGSRLLSLGEIASLGPRFVAAVGPILGSNAKDAVGVVSRKGRRLSERQVGELLAWLNPRSG